MTEVEELKLRIKDLELENAILRRKLNPQVRAFSPDLDTPLYHLHTHDPYYDIHYDSNRD